MTPTYFPWKLIAQKVFVLKCKSINWFFPNCVPIISDWPSTYLPNIFGKLVLDERLPWKMKKDNIYVKEELLLFIVTIACPCGLQCCEMIEDHLIVTFSWPATQKLLLLVKGFNLMMRNEMNCQSKAQILSKPLNDLQR